MQSYDAMNMSIWIWEFRGLGGIIPPRKSQRGIKRSGTAWCGMDPAAPLPRLRRPGELQDGEPRHPRPATVTARIRSRSEIRGLTFAPKP